MPAVKRSNSSQSEGNPFLRKKPSFQRSVSKSRASGTRAAPKRKPFPKKKQNRKFKNCKYFSTECATHEYIWETMSIATKLS